MGTVRIILDENDFATLIKGGIVKQLNAEILLSDIEFQQMLEIIMKEQPPSIHLYEGRSK